MNPRPSLLLITADCLRADHVGFMGYPRPTTPFLDSLAAESFVFPNAIVAGAPTYYSLPTILASRPPLALGRDIIGLAPGEPTLASILQESSYATAAFSAGNPYISARFGYDQGFDCFRDFLDSADVAPTGSSELAPAGSVRSRLNRRVEELASRSAPLRATYNELYFQYCQRFAGERPASFEQLRRFPAADVVVDQARAWLSSIGTRPFFLWVHFMDPHSPYYPVQEALGMMGEDGITPFHARYLNSFWNRGDKAARHFRRYRQEIIRLYDAGIRWVDAQTARLIETLRRLRRWDHCLLAFTADHGEEFLEHGGRYHQPLKLTEELIRVPLLVRVPGTLPSSLSSAPFSLLHLAPTLLEAVAVAPADEFHGCSHWQQIAQNQDWDEPAVVECVDGCTNPTRAHTRVQGRILAVRDIRYKLVLRFDPLRTELFDLQEDPAEHRPLAVDAERPVRGRLLHSALAHLRRSQNERNPVQRLSGLLRDVRAQVFLPLRSLHDAVPM